MPYFRLIEIFLLCIIFQGSFQENVQRKEKVFSLFSIVTFPNAGCASQSTTGSKARNGTCFTSTECAEKGGSISGNCAAGFGVCCLFITSTAGSTISQNCSYIQNPGFPTAYATTTAISFTVAKCATEVCTLRLDFCTFNTAAAVDDHDLTPVIDTFQISTTPNNGPIPAISGANSGYHMYVELGPDAGATATLAFTFGTSTIARSWEIKVTQVECSNRARPPTGCLQYHTGTTGRIETFNFQNTIQQHLHDQDYTICVRQDGYKCIRYIPCADTNSFAISEEAAAQSNLGTNCANDYVNIAGATSCSASAVTTGQYCGVVFNPVEAAKTAAQSNNVQAACDCTAPFTVMVVTNAGGTVEAATMVSNRGVCFEYQLYN